VLFEVVRNGVVESVHRGHAFTLDQSGRPIIEFGDVDVPMLPRSCNEPLQVVSP